MRCNDQNHLYAKKVKIQHAELQQNKKLCTSKWKSIYRMREVLGDNKSDMVPKYFPHPLDWLSDKDPTSKAGVIGVVGSIPGSRSLEEEMAMHSSVLARKIPCAEEPGGLVHRVAKSQTWLSDWEHMFDKRLICKINKEFLPFNNKKTKKYDLKMGRGIEQTFFQRRHTNGQTDGKMFSITNHQGSANLSHNEIITRHLLEELSSKRRERTSIVQKCRGKGTLVQDWWECKLVQPLRKTVWRFLKKLKDNHMIQQSHFWIYVQRKWKLDIKKILAFPCLLKHYSQKPGYGDNLSVHRWMNE